MAHLFEPTAIGELNLKNRFVRSATWEGLAQQDGSASGKLAEMMAELARNEVGLIITGYAYVAPEGQSGPWQLAACDDKFQPGLERLARAVHAAGGKIALQLVHAGKFSSAELTGQPPLGPSAEEKDGKTVCRSMIQEDIAKVTAAFARAASLAKRAGFDAVQLHAAHGFLLSQFLAPAFNTRTDAFGGSLENRARLLLDVVRSVRKSVGPEYPILVKLNSEDFLEHGMTREEAIQVARWLEAASVDAIELSGGTVASGERIPPRPGALKNPEQEVYYREAAERYQEQVQIPLMLVGGIRSLEVAEDLVRSGLTDFIALSRPLIGEPDLVKRWHAGDRRQAECRSCNGCFGPALAGKGLHCVVVHQD